MINRGIRSQSDSNQSFNQAPHDLPPVMILVLGLATSLRLRKKVCCFPSTDSNFVFLSLFKQFFWIWAQTCGAVLCPVTTGKHADPPVLMSSRPLPSPVESMTPLTPGCMAIHLIFAFTIVKLFCVETLSAVWCILSLCNSRRSWLAIDWRANNCADIPPTVLAIIP